MATGLGGEVAVESTEESVPVVLRVKRKRTEDPAESLGGSQKNFLNGLSLYQSL